MGKRGGERRGGEKGRGGERKGGGTCVMALKGMDAPGCAGHSFC